MAFRGPQLPGHGPALENSAMSQPADYDWSPLDLDGSPVAFSQFRGKPLFLNVWATWCGPCVREMPSIARLAADPRLQGKNIQFVCVSVDQSADEVRRFLAGKNWGMTFLRAERLPAVFHTDGIPATFLIDAKGRIAASEVGSADWSTAEVVAFLDKLAKTGGGP